jgi:hypothetical protein
MELSRNRNICSSPCPNASKLSPKPGDFLASPCGAENHRSCLSLAREQLIVAASDPNAEWIGNVQPIGLVLAATVLARHGLNPAEQTLADSEAVRALLSGDDDGPALPDPWAFFAQILGWRPTQVSDVPGGPALSADSEGHRFPTPTRAAAVKDGRSSGHRFSGAQRP